MLETINLEKTKLVIIGGGPAGASAMLYAQRALLNPVWFTGDHLIEGALPQTSEVENYLGFTKIKGIDLLQNFYNHSRTFLEEGKSNIFNYKINSITKTKKHSSNNFLLTSEIKDQKIYNIIAENIIVATGANPKELLFKGVDILKKNYKLSYCGLCDGWKFKKKDIVIVGGGNAAFEEAIYLSNLVKNIKILIRRDKARAFQIYQKKIEELHNVKICYNTQILELKELKGDKIKLKTNNPKEEIIKCNGIFVKIGYEPNTSFIKDLNVDLDINNYVKQHPSESISFETNVPGIYAIGDIRSDLEKQISIAIDSGIKCVLEISKKIDNLN